MSILFTASTVQKIAFVSAFCVGTVPPPPFHAIVMDVHVHTVYSYREIIIIINNVIMMTMINNNNNRPAT